MRRALAERIELVDQLHQRRYGGVEVHSLLDVDGHPPNRVVRLAPKRPLGLGTIVAARRNAFSADRLGPMIDEPPHPHQKAEAALEAVVAPFHFLLGRRHEHHVQTQRVGAVSGEHFVGVDNVALRLGHDVAAFEHHALCE